MVGIQYGLHRIANVVDSAAERLRVGIPIAHGVGIGDPEESALRDHDVRIAVEVQENFGVPIRELLPPARMIAETWPVALTFIV